MFCALFSSYMFCREKHDLFSGDLEKRPLSNLLPNLGIGTTLSLCFKRVRTPFEHKSYFIQIALDAIHNGQSSFSGGQINTGTDCGLVHWILRFVAPQESESRGRVILETTQRQYEDTTVERSLPITAEILERLNNVLSATNFSYCLRNSEHLARYIVEGYWHSLQMKRDGEIRQFFAPILQPDHLCHVASLPSDLLAKKTLIDVAPLFDGTEMINFDNFVSVEDFKLTGDAYNIVIAGPTGAGKSTLANIFFNARVSKTDNKDAVSVTRTFHVVHGNYRCEDNRIINVNIVDTMGLCDLFVEDEEAVQVLSGAILTEYSKIDKVVIVLSETPITAAHKLAIKDLLRKLSYEDNKENFVFLYNKTEGLNESTKMELLMKMGEELGVEVDYKIPVAMPGRGTLETTTYFLAGVAIGTDVADYNNPESRHTIDVVKNNLLPHCSTVLRYLILSSDIFIF